MNKNLTNIDGLSLWNTLLSVLDVTNTWERSSMNLHVVKSTIASHSLYASVPLLVVGVQQLFFTPFMSSDVDCFLQDPTGKYTVSHLNYL